MQWVKNIFTKGCWKDFDVRYQPEGTFYESMNGRIIGIADGNFAWENIKGTTKKFELCSSDYRPIGIYPMTKYFKENGDPTALEQSIIIHSTDGTRGSITEVTIDVDGNLEEVITRYTHADLNYSTEHQIEGYGFYENEMVRRHYWTDNYNQPRSMNLANFVNVPTGSLIVGEVYLVTCGTATHNGTPYSAGSTFTAVNANYTGTATIVAYTSVNMMNFTPEYMQGEIDMIEIILGSLKCGKYYYTYQLLNNDGSITPWSMLYGGYVVYQETGYGDKVQYQKIQGGNYTEDSGHGIKLSISNIDTNFNRIRVAAFFSNDYNLIQTGIIFYEGYISGATMEIDHTGNDIGEDITLETVTAVSATILTVKTIDNIKYFNVLANLTEQNEIDYTPSPTIAVEYYELPTDDLSTVFTGTIEKDPLTPTTYDNAMTGHRTFSWATGVPSGWILPGQWYKVTVRNVLYNGTEYGPNAPATSEFFYGYGTFAPGSVVANYAAATGAGTPIVRPYLRIKRYTRQDPGHVGEVVYKDIPQNNQFLDYKGEAVNGYAVGYWGYETYRVGLMFFDTYGKPRYIRWAGDIQIPMRRGATDQMVNLYNYVLVGGNDDYYEYTNLRVASLLLSNIDITDIINDISGVAVVVAPRQRQIIMEGHLNMMEAFGGNTYQAPMLCDWTLFTGNPRENNLYAYISPDMLFGREPWNPQTGDYLNLDSYWRTMRWDFGGGTAWDRMGLALVTNYHMCQKMYVPYNVSFSGVGVAVDSQNTILNYVESGFAVAGTNSIPGYTIYGRSDLATRRGYHTRCIFIKTEESEGGGGTYPFGFGDFMSFAAITPTVSLRRPQGNLYGGTGLNALSLTSYRFTGTYLPLTTTVKNQLSDTGDYTTATSIVIDGMQVFGGDTFINIFDNERLLKNTFEEDFGGTNNYSHVTMTPVQSSVNIALRNGRHAAKDYMLEKTGGAGPYTFQCNLADCLVYNCDYDEDGTPELTRLEQWNYNDAYSTHDPGVAYPALPLYFLNNNVFKVRARWSNRKTYGELVDSFRTFSVNDFKDIESNNGQINNIRSKLGRLYYWQRDGLGYFPVEERILTADPLGTEVELGTGTAFARYDDKYSTIGNQHQWGLAETDSGFVWYDAIRRAYIHMDAAFGLKEESIIKGMEQFFEALPVELLSYDNPAHPTTPKGIFTYHNKKYKTIYTTFVFDDNIDEWKYTVGYNYKIGAFEDQYQFFPGIGLYFNDFLFTNVPNTRDFHLHDVGAYGSFYGTVFNAYVKIVVTDPKDISKVYDLIEMIGNSQPFSTVYYNNSWQTTNDVLYTVAGGLNRNYEYRNRRYIGNIPIIDSVGSGRMADDYLVIKFEVDNTRNVLVRLMEVLTKIRKYY